MDFNALIKRVIAILTKPNEEWATIQSESISIKDLYLKFALIVYALPSVALFFGWLFMGAPFGITLLMAILLYVLTLVTIYVLGILIDVIGAQFGGSKDMEAAQRLAVYSFTPYAIVGILFIFPLRSFFFGGGAVRWLVILISLYSIYLLYLGAQKLKNITGDKLVPFIIIIAVIWIILSYLAFWISWRLAFEISIGSTLRGYRYR